MKQCCKQSKNQKGSNCCCNFLSITMGAIAIAQAILIIIVSIVIFSHQHERTDSHNVDSDFNVDIPLADGSNQDVDTLTLHNITQVPTITKKNYTVDSFGTDYMTILLSLITLCATLAVVIPYLIGKIYTESQVDSKVQEAKDECQKEVENLFSQSNDNLKKESEKYRNQFEDLKNEYSKRIHDVDNAINQNIKALDVEVGHNARMISYLLSHKIGKKKMNYRSTYGPLDGHLKHCFGIRKMTTENIFI